MQRYSRRRRRSTTWLVSLWIANVNWICFLIPSLTKKITTSSMSIYCIHMMSCLVSIIVSSVSFASVMVIHGLECPPTVIGIDQLHNFPAIYSRCVLVLPSHQMYYTWLMTMYWQVTLIMYVMSQDWYALWNIAARMDIPSHHDFVFFHLHAANVFKPHAMSLLFRTTHCRRRYVDGILFCPMLHT